MELVDPNICTANTIPNIFCQQDTNNEIIFKSPLKGDGWGSTQATEMVLNNLFYISVKVRLLPLISVMTIPNDRYDSPIPFTFSITVLS